MFTFFDKAGEEFQLYFEMNCERNTIVSSKGNTIIIVEDFVIDSQIS